jgi:hypothetical protein
MPRPTVELNRKGQPGKAALVLDPISYEIPRAKVATILMKQLQHYLILLHNSQLYF